MPWFAVEIYLLPIRARFIAFEHRELEYIEEVSLGLNVLPSRVRLFYLLQFAAIRTIPPEILFGKL